MEKEISNLETISIILKVISALGAFTALIILGPQHKVSQWLFPGATVCTIIASIFRHDWEGIIGALIFYGIMYYFFFRKKKPG